MNEEKLIKLDQFLFRGFFYNFRSNFVERDVRRSIQKTNDYQFVISYKRDPQNQISRLCDKYGSDKGEIIGKDHPYSWVSHTYTDFYDLLFFQKRSKIQMVLECGLGTSNPDLPSSMGKKGKPGASIRAWKDYFPNATVIGIDIDRDTLFSEERIETYQVDQTSRSSIQEFLEKISGRPLFDVIIDDGLHEFEAGINLFEGVNNYLSPDGIYLIEDVLPTDFRLYVDYFNKCENTLHVRYVNLFRPNSRLKDNSLIMITKKVT